MQHDIPPGHPVDTFLLENQALRMRIGQMRAAIERLREHPRGEPFDAIVTELRQAQRDLACVEHHYLRKEGLLFPCLERYGITGPSTVMWGGDDQIRGRLVLIGRRLQEYSQNLDELLDAAGMTIEPALEEMERAIVREERDLFPMALDTLSDEDWAGIWRRSVNFGWCLVEPREGYQPPVPPEPVPADDEAVGSGFVFPTGRLTADELRWIFPTLPLDFTFIDADDRVRFYSLGPDPIFSRIKTDLGQKVEDCHPAKSVPLVKRILADFRSGKLDVVDSWINHQGKFAHIRYFAVRNDAGQYVGTVEMVQDIKPLRELQGECRLAQYHASPASGE
jgi:DUF438 domain-containing protein